MMYGWDTGTWAWMTVWMLVIAIALVVVVVVATRGAFRGSEPRDTADAKPATDILDERFARGEIDREEYEERRRVLTHSG